MIATVHLGTCLITIPQFPNGGGTILCHISPRRIGGVGSQQISDICITLIAQLTEQPGDTNDTTGDMTIALGNDVGHDILDDRLSAGIGYKSESERQQIGGSCIVTIIDTVRIKWMPRNG